MSSLVGALVVRDLHAALARGPRSLGVEVDLEDLHVDGGGVLIGGMRLGGRLGQAQGSAP